MDPTNTPRIRKHYRYQPDDSKCDYCFHQVRRCDRNLAGEPCTPCKRSRSYCINQTQSSRSFINPKDRCVKRKLLNMERTEQVPPCVRCYEKNHTCIRHGPQGRPCNFCKRAVCSHTANQCQFDLTNANQETKINSRAGGEPSVAYDQKCYRCADKVRACNGEFPCNNCATVRSARFFMAVADTEDRKNLPKCVNCKRTQRYCNRDRPCSTCIRLKMNCIHIDQGALLTRVFAVDGAPTLANQKLNMLRDDE